MSNPPSPSPNSETPHVRKLVTVRRISAIQKDKKSGRDFARLDGWTVCVRRSKYAAGDFVVFFEIDSFLPASDGRYWELLAYDKSLLRGREGFRVRSLRIGTRISQGLVFPLHDFPEITTLWDGSIAALGADAARRRILSMSFEHILGVEKYVAAMDDQPFAALGGPPCFIHQPAWERAQNIRDLFAPARRNARYQITEKLNGWSMSVYWVRRGSPWFASLTGIPDECKPVMEAPDGSGRFGVCTREQDFLANEGNPLWRTALQMDLLRKIRQIGVGGDVAVQGEFVGADVMGNTMGFAEGEHTFRAFAVWDIDKQRYLSVDKTMEICERLEIPHTPVVRCCRLGEFARDLKDLVQKAEGVGINGQIREGLVFKTMDGQKQFKVISNAWLLSLGE